MHWVKLKMKNIWHIRQLVYEITFQLSILSNGYSGV